MWSTAPQQSAFCLVFYEEIRHLLSSRFSVSGFAVTKGTEMKNSKTKWPRGVERKKWESRWFRGCPRLFSLSPWPSPGWLVTYRYTCPHAQRRHRQIRTYARNTRFSVTFDILSVSVPENHLDGSQIELSHGVPGTWRNIRNFPCEIESEKVDFVFIWFPYG